MTHETAAALKELSRRIFETEQKLDNYFKQLHDANAEKISLMAAAADDQMAARGIGLYPPFDEVVGTKLKTGTRVVFNGTLYKYKGDASTEIVATWNPVDATSIWEAINIEHTGTAEDPIPWAVNMQCYEGKYYTFDNVLYLCIRDSGIALAHTPDQLIGNYFELA